MKKGYKTCPFCANEIKDGAIKCQFCGEFLDGKNHNSTKHTEQKLNNSNNKKYWNYLWFGLGAVIIGVIIYSLLFESEKETSSINPEQNDSQVIDLKEDTNDIKEKTFNTSIDTSSWKTYDDGEISFQYPSYMIVGNTKFEDFSFFTDPTNIHIQKYDFKSFFEPMIEEIRLAEEDFCDYYDEIKGACHPLAHDEFYNKHIERFKNILKKINSGEKIERDGFFDHFSGFWTKGPFVIKNVTVNGVKGLLIYYYFTQDPDGACFTQFNTELLLVKDNDKIYSFMFKNNFGGVYDLMKQYDHQYGESCLHHTLGNQASFVNRQLEQFYEFGTSLKGTDYEVFAENDEIIKSIVNTVVIK